MSAAMLEPRPEMRMATRLRGMRQLTSRFAGGCRPTSAYGGIPAGAMPAQGCSPLGNVAAPVYWHGRSPGAPFEYSKSHYAGAYSLRSGHGLGNHEPVDARRLSPVPGRQI